MNSSGSCAPPPPPINGSSVPSRRLPTQPQSEMPSCVQNAMMKQDKKPFTYTPTGIDLSQIKSPRMAERLLRNANSEGVTNQPRPLQSNGAPVGQPNSLGAQLGTPVQVFPNGPPPPPPSPKNQLGPNSANGTRSPSVTRKSPTPQIFEPPPMGCRPEIKIPPNPMAALKKVPQPKVKDEFWKDEYIKERSKSPNPNAEQNNNQNASASDTQQQTHLPEPVCQVNAQGNQNQANASKSEVNGQHTPSETTSNWYRPAPPKEESSNNNNRNFAYQNNNGQNSNAITNNVSNSPQQRIYSPYASQPQRPISPKPQTRVQAPQNQDVPYYLRSNQQNQTVAPSVQSTPLYKQPSADTHDSPYYAGPGQRAVSPTPPSWQRQQAQDNQQNSSSHPQNIPIYQRPSQRAVSPAPAYNHPSYQQNQQQNTPIYMRTNQNQNRAPSPSVQRQPQYQQPQYQQQSQNQPGRQYYQPQRVVSPPVAPQNSRNVNPTSAYNAPASTYATPKLSNQQTPPWVVQRENGREANQNDNAYYRPEPTYNNQYNNNGYQNNQGGRERIVPIQHSQNANNSAYSAQPYQNATPQYNRVQAPYSSQTYPGNQRVNESTSPFINYANKFVDQGYQNVQPWDINNRVSSPANYGNTGRIIPIQLEDGRYLNGPISKTPTVIQNDLRDTPNQSKSFRVLQKITDTYNNDPYDIDTVQAAELQQPHYSRPLGPNDMNENQLRKLRLNDRNQGGYDSHQQQYHGSSPRSFKLLHDMTTPENAADAHASDFEYDYCPYYEPEQEPYTVSLPDTPVPSEWNDQNEAVDLVQAINHYESERNTFEVQTRYYRNDVVDEVCQSHVPRIIVTPTPEDDDMQRASERKPQRFEMNNRTGDNFTSTKSNSKLNESHRNNRDFGVNAACGAISDDEDEMSSNSSDSSVIENDNRINRNDIVPEPIKTNVNYTPSATETNERPLDIGSKRQGGLFGMRSISNINALTTNLAAEVNEELKVNGLNDTDVGDNDTENETDNEEMDSDETDNEESDNDQHVVLASRGLNETEQQKQQTQEIQSSDAPHVEGEQSDESGDEEEVEEIEYEETETEGEEVEEDESQEEKIENVERPQMAEIVQSPLQIIMWEKIEREKIENEEDEYEYVYETETETETETEEDEIEVKEAEKVENVQTPQRVIVWETVEPEVKPIQTEKEKIEETDESDESGEEEEVVEKLPEGDQIQTEHIREAEIVEIVKHVDENGDENEDIIEFIIAGPDYEGSDVPLDDLSEIEDENSEDDKDKGNKNVRSGIIKKEDSNKKEVVTESEEEIEEEVTDEEIEVTDEEIEVTDEEIEVTDEEIEVTDEEIDVTDDESDVDERREKGQDKRGETENRNKEKFPGYEDKASSVTVRLPLRLSFRRSSNDEEITTVIVGNSEMEDGEFSDNEDISEVSASFNLRRSHSKSFERSNKSSSFDLPNSKASFDDDPYDSEVSVSVSLPLKEKKAKQPKRLSCFNNTDLEYKPWKLSRDESEDRDFNTNKSIENPIHDESLSPNKELNYYHTENSKFKCNVNEATVPTVQDRTTPFESFKKQKSYYQNSDNNNYRKSWTSTDDDDDDDTDASDKSVVEPLPQNYNSIINTSRGNSDTEVANEKCEGKKSVRDRVAAFERTPVYHAPKRDISREISLTHEEDDIDAKTDSTANIKTSPEPQKYSTVIQKNRLLDKNSYIQRSVQEESEDDSGVTSDISRRISEDADDTESECFPELRKMTKYERAATHSRLFKLLQDYDTEPGDADKNKNQSNDEQLLLSTRPKKIIHNVSITRKRNPELLKQAESLEERRERLSSHLLKQSSSLDADSLSSPMSSTLSVNEKLVDELVQSVLKQQPNSNLKHIPLEKIQAAARKALQQEIDSDTPFSSFDSTPALTPQEFKDDYDAYESEPGRKIETEKLTPDIMPSKAFKNLQEQSVYGRKRKLWAVRCPRVLSSKAVNSDLTRVSEIRESQSPEPLYAQTIHPPSYY